jgi:hypothetical protein
VSVVQMIPPGRIICISWLKISVLKATACDGKIALPAGASPM